MKHKYIDGMILRCRTIDHLIASRKYPSRNPACYFLDEKAAKRETRRTRKERKRIALWFRLVRADPEHGPEAARNAHRYVWCSTGREANQRIEAIS